MIRRLYRRLVILSAAHNRDQCYNCLSVSTATQIEHESSPRITAAPVVVALTLLAVLLRFWRLGAKSLWFDEALTAWLVQAPSHVFTRTIWRGGESNMALYYVIMRAWIHLGSSEWILRSFSAVTGIAAVPIFYVLAKRLFGSRVGLVAALLLTVNACHVAYSQEARSYALFFLLAILSSYFFVRAITTDSISNYIVYAVISAVAVYTHFFALLLVAAQWTSLLALPREKIPWRKLLLTAILLAVLASPALFFILGRNTGQLSWVPKPNFRDLQRFGYFLVADQGTLRQPLLAAYLVLAAVAVVTIFKRRTDEPGALNKWKVALLVSWSFLPPAVAFVVSLWKPVFVPRFLIFCLAPLLLLTAAGLAQIRPSWLRHSLTLALAAASLVPTFWYYRQPKEQWREAVQYIANHAHPGDSVILFGNYARVPFEYYRTRVTWAEGVSFIAVSDPTRPAAPHDSPSSWVLIHGDGSDPGAQHILPPRSRQVSVARFFMVTIRLYSSPISQQTP